MTSGPVVVYGATGHTGRFVVAELLDRGLPVVAAGRDPARLEALAEGREGVTVRPATVDDAASLDRALAGAAAVVNCAGPFAITAGPVVGAALRAGVPYVDVAAEIEANLAMFADHGDDARAVGVPVVPAMAFFGGLGDLLATAALGGRTVADDVHVAYGLSSWRPTEGTRAAGRVSHDRRGGRRVRFAGGALEYHDDPPSAVEWDFPEPWGRRTMVAGFTMADVVTVPSHIRVGDVRTSMSAEAARDLADPDTPAPEAADARGRSDQTFVVDVVVTADGVERRATASGQDIYAVTAPLAVEAVQRVLDGRVRATGVVSAGAAFDAAAFLRALSPHVVVDLPT
ncbi:saccharopine dehydrogenase NADP-binding domain-containing protein [Actinotalea ferrariae]|uniref:saccharopine dehydrogenase family protein n=1 Tax=Actinotalea ferrariae TaxID=1386098 RepID=UPI001C8B4920|nr:saccharopine dehydrogenase NADP-binding domain-containing protein [Actinotalea ferrariae]MBX9245206.1 saccharopine dehydrogenase NADP-binding domain-containing protein [Actinotalea ferrariae]